MAIPLQPLVSMLDSRLRAFANWLRSTVPADLGAACGDEQLAGSIRARQLQAVLRLTPLTAAACAVNSCVVLQAFWRDVSHVLLVAWAAMVWLIAMIGLPAWWASRRHGSPSTLSAQTLGRVVTNSALLSLLWFLLPVALMPGTDVDRQMLVALITVGMLGGGGSSLATVPRAAIIFAGLQAFGLMIGLLSDPTLVRVNLVVLLVAFTTIVIASIISTARTFGARLLAESEADRQKQLVGLLLHDFGENAGDWLWETDADGRLRYVSIRLVEAIGRPADQLHGLRLVGLIAESHGEPDDEYLLAIDGLARAMQRDAPFRDLAVPVRLEDGLHWWALTAKPLFDTHGRFNGWRGVGSDVTRQRQLHQEMSQLAHYDSLTGLANRHHFRTQLGQVRDPRDRRVKPCALFFMDLDNFKNVNDSLGHEVGDRVLQAIARRLSSCVRRGDLLARLGGDEFALLSWGAHQPEELVEVANRLILAMREPLRIGDLRVVMGGSIGIASSPADGVDPDGLLKGADLAMYAAKAAGRNTFRFFSREMDDRARYRLGIQHDLREAMAAGQLNLYFQPQFHLATGRAVGFEALIRWQHPERGAISPAEFVPVAEETGLIDQIGAWVLQRACAEAAQWPDDYRVCVNVSAVQFASQRIVDSVRQALDGSGLPAHRLELEITESVLMQDSISASQQLGELREIGVRISLDDFGTGYSALAYLRNFPMDRLKIDRSFVESMDDDSGTHAIVQAIIDLASALNLETTAEGVETVAQMTMLRDKGCDEVQGFLLSRPMPVHALSDFISAQATAAA
ncbi:MAG: EAL domain-containing protein [Burkholderiaceae bacterium]